MSFLLVSLHSPSLLVLHLSMSVRRAERESAAAASASASGSVSESAGAAARMATSPHQPAPARNKRGRGAMLAAEQAAQVELEAAAVSEEAADASAGVRKGGRASAAAEVRPAQLAAMQRVATVAVEGVDCPSWYGFKSAEFVQKRTAGVGPGRQWRTVRQILDRENYHLLPANATTYLSMRSAPSALPPRKYSDVSGLPSRYMDPRTRLHLHALSEYSEIKGKSTETIKLMLEIRGQAPTHQLLLR
jgi:INO80 complex subunit C